MFPKVAYKEYRWEPRVDLASYDLWQRKEVRAKYKAAVLKPIAQVKLSVDPRIGELYQHAIETVVRFDTELEQKAIVMPEILLRSESASSSQIEHLSASARNIALAELGDASRRNAMTVAGNIRAMKKALEQKGRLSVSKILRIHKALLENTDGEIAGKLRTEQVWIGGSGVSPHGADFVPPHHENVKEYLVDWVRFANRDDVHGLLKTAVAHCQFETIHPFLDGNGRTGRALVQVMLHEAGLIRKSALPISAGLLADVKNYFLALDAFRGGDVTPMVEQICKAAIEAVDVGRRTVGRFEALRAEWDELVHARRDAAVWRLAELLCTRPVVSAKYAAEALGVTDTAARNAIGQLLSAGILKNVGGRRRDVLYEAPAVTAIMDAFAGEPRRRR
jgi:Fic family protein